jgi:hypothetical protein
MTNTPILLKKDEQERRYARMFGMSKPAWHRMRLSLSVLGFDERGECKMLDRLWHTGRKSMRDLLAMARIPSDKRESVMAAIESGKAPPWDARKISIVDVKVPHNVLTLIVETTQSAYIALEPYQHLSEVALALAALDKLQARSMDSLPTDA